MEGSNERLADALNTFRGIHKKHKRKLLKEDVIINTTQANIVMVRHFADFLMANNRHTNTILRHLYGLKKFIVLYGETKDLASATREDIQHAIGTLNGSEMAPETKRKICITTKLFYKQLKGEGLVYPKEVAWIKSGVSKSKGKLPEDLLSEEEVLKMISVVRHPRDKALIAVLFDTGCRVGELVSLRLKDVDLKRNPAHLTVNGKTGMRQVPIVLSVPYIVKYLETIPHLTANDELWASIGTWSNTGTSLESGAVRKILREAAKSAGIQKRVYPHLFRHSRASDYANRLTEQQLKVFFGWTGSSNMPATYVHISGKNIDDAVMVANGKKPEDPKVIKTDKSCSRCQYSNSLSSVYCSRCGLSLDIQGIVQAQEDRDMIEQAIAEYLENPKKFKSMVREHLMKNHGKTANEIEIPKRYQ